MCGNSHLQILSFQKLADSLTTTTAPSPSPSPASAALPDFAPITVDAFRNPVSIVTMASIATLLVLLVISVICCVCMGKSEKKRTHYVEDLEESLVLPTISRNVSLTVRKSEYGWSVDV